jgi:hypothetical protein
VLLDQDQAAEARGMITESIAIRQQLGERISLAQSRLVLASIQLEEGDAGGAEATAREAAQTFREVGTRSLEASAELAIARALLARSEAKRANERWQAAEGLLRDSQDVRLTLTREVVRAAIQTAMGRKQEASAVLNRALGEAHRFGLVGAQLEIRLAMAGLNRAGAAALASDARRSGFLRISRKASS